MKVLLTGAAGFIGTQIAAALRAKGHEVVGLDVLLPAAHHDAVLPEGVVRGDVAAPDIVAHLLDGVDVVCHQAAMVGAGVNAADAPAYGRHNDYATTVLLAQMYAAGVSRLVLASSMVVYGQGGFECPKHGAVDPLPRRRADLDAGMFEHRCPLGDEPVHWTLVDEDAPLKPRSLYAASKTAQEHYALAWAEASGGSVTALRYHNVYGAGMPRDTPYSGVAAIFRSALEKGQAPKVFEDGGQMRDFVHVSDVAAANVAAVESPAQGFLAANVCSGQPISILDVAGIVCEARGGPAPEVTGQYRSGDVRHIVASPEGAAASLGFRASVSPQEGLRDFAFAPLRA
ncbi:NAD-dependent epimerase/dehydratase family protein [Mycolicibacterium tokaiense]|uniref:UDP-glucose 4-epimerase n=1 Tax=Mycolicibacterium tokaiense TaxID=39695 RepID=A0A378TBR7_9MYCO|nr:NAD-dependent epimerase/dehydratase family protein [Mycolicibacterium tokaiense]BBY87214.1 UDP-glucose 4-epimerase [Mycolicibacterium tokaiense]STZ58268.1 UDP-glucose 4-epimerase [Mycolicibacterium tokaiense]